MLLFIHWQLAHSFTIYVMCTMLLLFIHWQLAHSFTIYVMCIYNVTIYTLAVGSFFYYIRNVYIQCYYLYIGSWLILLLYT